MNECNVRYQSKEVISYYLVEGGAGTETGTSGWPVPPELLRYQKEHSAGVILLPCEHRNWTRFSYCSAVMEYDGTAVLVIEAGDWDDMDFRYLREDLAALKTCQHCPTCTCKPSCTCTCEPNHGRA